MMKCRKKHKQLSLNEKKNQPEIPKCASKCTLFLKKHNSLKILHLTDIEEAIVITFQQ